MNCLMLLANAVGLALAPKASVYQSVGPTALRTTSAPKNASRTHALNGLRTSSAATRLAVGVAGPFGAIAEQSALLRTWRTMVDACSGFVIRLPLASRPK